MGSTQSTWGQATMSTKILRTSNATRAPPDEVELSVAQALIDLEASVADLKAELRPLQISSAREAQLKAFHKIQGRLTRELEKKFSDRHVVFIAQRRMVRKPGRNSRAKQPRPRSRTLKEVHDKILEDLVCPTEITGKRVRQGTDGNKTIKVFLDAKDATSMEYKLDSFSSVYNKLTGKTVVFQFAQE